MTEPLPPEPGDLLIVDVIGAAGAIIGIGQMLLRDECRGTHVAICTGPVGPNGEDLIQAEPGGAAWARVTDYAGREKWWTTGHVILTPEQRSTVVAAAIRHLGTPYSFADYAALAYHRATEDHQWARPTALDRYVADTGHMMCSQLGAVCWGSAGVQLDPTRIPQAITPGDTLYRALPLLGATLGAVA